jgi:nitrite reductase/ring-hydroxylating ferredoxin subunit
MSGEPRSTLPAGFYLDPDAFVRERRTIFAEAWQMIARIEALEAPGDYVCNNLAGLPAFVMRSASREVGAFRNACRHQKLPVLDAGAGRCALLRCRYHGWTYHFDGTFKEAPAQFAPTEKASAAHNLRRLPLADWRGFLFVAPDDEGEAFAAAIEPIESAVNRVLANAVSRVGEITTDFGCNWKLIVEHWLAKYAAGEMANNGSVWLYHFPTLILQANAEALVAHQLIVRSFDRTRVVSHILARDAAVGSTVIGMLKIVLAEDKATCDARYGEAAARGAIEHFDARPDSVLGDFRSRIQAAHRRAEALS